MAWTVSSGVSVETVSKNEVLLDPRPCRHTTCSGPVPETRAESRPDRGTVSAPRYRSGSDTKAPQTRSTRRSRSEIPLMPAGTLAAGAVAAAGPRGRCPQFAVAEPTRVTSPMRSVRLKDTLTGEPVELQPGPVGIYACGPTVYSRIHVG